MAISQGFNYWLAGAICVSVLSGCGGNDSHPQNAHHSPSSPVDTGSSQPGETPGDGAADTETTEVGFFQARLQSESGFCRTCHIPGGVADVEDGRGLTLSNNTADDYDLLYQAWQTLGGGVDTNPLLVEASDPNEPHSGGKPWPEGSPAYQAMRVLLSCWEETEDCSLADADTSGQVELEPLLGSARGGHLWFDYCEDDGSGAPRHDSAVLPADPRALVQPGVSEGRAVHFNAFWKDCHADPELVGEAPHPETCGELRSSWQRGHDLMTGNGEPGSGTFFAGDDHQAAASSGIAVDDYNRLWQFWGMTERPDNFDELVAERYGMPMGDTRNPYPLPGEDPNQTNGGSGQLPAFMTQLRGPGGEWQGVLGFTCHTCHSGAAGAEDGGELLYGSGNSLHDIGLMAKELGISASTPGIIFSLFGTSRGTNNASDVNLFFLANQEGSRSLDEHFFGVLTSGSTASGDTPAWWNIGHRPVKFQDGYFAADASRVDLIFYTPIDGVLGGEDGENWVRDHAQDADKWMMSLKSPEYPLPIDTALAEQGAVLFHSKNLWADNLDNPVPEPEGGNGSCASCHGAYSPRFVNDPAFLADPTMEGVASNIAPKRVIRTDPARVDTNNESVNQYGANSFLGFSETVGSDQDCGPQNRAELRGDREMGYLAPPLYGVWATAPYLHNGAIPDVWTLLKPQDRPALWRRVSTPARADQAGQVVMGYDVNLERAYDQQKMGWRYDELECGDGTIPFFDCMPGDQNSPIFQDILAQLYGNTILTWNLGNLPVFGQMTTQQIESRKIYNTHLYSQGNEGHDFTVVLNDTERRAIIEYLKTL